MTNQMYAEIEKKIKKLREYCRPITNCYTDKVTKVAEAVWEEGDSFLFSYNDHGIRRLIYYASDTESLGKLLAKPITNLDGIEYAIDFLSRDENENKNLFEAAGYQTIARMMRISNPDCRKISFPLYECKNGFTVGQADAADTVEINRMLWSVFDTRISRLVNDIELEESIKEGEVCIHRGKEGDIDAVLQTIMQPRKLYINQVYNRAEKYVIHTMLQSRINQYIESGGKYMYAWVEADNIASLKFHLKYGMKHDGMWDLIYVYGKNENN